MTATEFTKWLLGATPGEKAEYHRGLSLTHERPGIDSPVLRTASGAQSRANAAGLAWQAYEKGAVTLVQRRNGYADTSYLAIKRRVMS